MAFSRANRVFLPLKNRRHQPVTFDPAHKFRTRPFFFVLIVDEVDQQNFILVDLGQADSQPVVENLVWHGLAC